MVDGKGRYSGSRSTTRYTYVYRPSTYVNVASYGGYYQYYGTSGHVSWNPVGVFIFIFVFILVIILLVVSKNCNNIVIDDGFSHHEEMVVIEQHHPGHTVVVEHTF